MEFTKLEIKKFRHIENEIIELGSIMTAIAGQNGTGKSTILGWIAQSCDAKLSNKTLLNSTYKSKYSEIFRFCPEQDYNKTYELIIYYKNPNGLELEESKKMTTRLIQSENRYRVDFDGRGNALDFPLVFLGLKRLIPLATEKNINIIDSSFDKSDQLLFAKLAKEILFLTRENIKPESIKSTNKQIVAMKTDDYSHLGNSAGQDNLGQIISSLLSFNKLKNELKEDYKGGLLLIDEIDATLYAGSQVKLVEKLFNLAKNLKIQIIFTTHSIEILEFLSKKSGTESKINFLKWKNKNVINEINPNIELIKNNIKVQVGVNVKEEKIPFICEDIVAELWSKNIINNSELKGKIEITKGPLPEGTLVTMANSKHPNFKTIKYILDGDCKKQYKNKKVPKTAFLPGEFKPEQVLYNFIYELVDDDSFWDNEINYTHQTCFGKYFVDKNYKKWFNDEVNQSHFGRGCSKIFNRWKKDNQTEVEEFINQLKNIIK